MIRDLIVKNRSYRRFHEDQPVARSELLELVDLARLSASAANMQPLKFFVSCDEATNVKIFDCLGWAAYLTDWPGPAPGERPPAYIVILGDTVISRNFWCDHGIAAQSILLGAVEKGYGGCMIASIKKQQLMQALDIPERYEILLVIAIGRPAERVTIEPVGPQGDIRYWRDDQGVHHVPKRSLDEIVIERF